LQIEKFRSVPRLFEKPKIPLRISPAAILVLCMIRSGFLDPESRNDLIDLGRDDTVARRANALVLLDDGMSCASVAKVLLLDDDTVRIWCEHYQEDGIEGLASFGHEGGARRPTLEQQDKLKAWIAATLPRSIREVGAWIARERGIEYQPRSGLIALLHRLDMEHRRPKAISRKLDQAKLTAFIADYESLINRIEADETVVFADAVHPRSRAPSLVRSLAHTFCTAGWLLGTERRSHRGRTEQRAGPSKHPWRNRPRNRPDREEGRADRVDALSTIMLLTAIEARFPGMRFVHVFLDNARYHHAKLVQAWLARPGWRIQLHFVPAYCPHLNSIERLWGLMHRHITHNKRYGSFKELNSVMQTFLREEVPKNWVDYCDQVTDKFRVITQTEFRIIA
jgi:transposase